MSAQNTEPKSLNFRFLKKHNLLLDEIASHAESLWFIDPNSSVLKTRVLAEMLSKHLASHRGLYISEEDSQLDILKLLEREGVIDANLAKVFHTMRILGNKAAHQHACTSHEAIELLKMARHIAVWFHRAMGAPDSFQARPFIDPPSEGPREAELRATIERLNNDRQSLHQEKDVDKQREEELLAQLLAAEEQRQQEAKERSVALGLAAETEIQIEEERKKYEAELRAKSQEIRARSVALRAANTKYEEQQQELAQLSSGNGRGNGDGNGSRDGGDADGQDDWVEQYNSLDWQDIHDFYYERLRKSLPPFEEYEAPAKLGSGGWGAAYEVAPVKPGATVVVKIAHASRGDVDALRRVWDKETKIARRLALISQTTYPDGIVTVVRAPSADEPMGFLIYEHAKRPTISKILAVSGIDCVSATHCVAKIACTLHNLLNIKVYFTDLHPENIVVRPASQTVLIDPAECMPGRCSPPEWRSAQHRFHTGPDNREFIARGQCYLLGFLYLHMMLGSSRVTEVLSDQPGQSCDLASLSHFLKDVQSDSDEELIVEQVRGLVHERFQASSDPQAATAPVNKIVDFLKRQCSDNPSQRCSGPQEFQRTLRSIWKELHLPSC